MNNITKELKGFRGLYSVLFSIFSSTMKREKKEKIYEFAAEKIGFVITVTSNSSL